MSLQPVAESIKAHLPEILEEWQSAAECDPWIALPRESRVNDLENVARGLVDVALSEGPSAEMRLKEVRWAAGHGKHRLEMGLPDHIIFAEYRILRQALWNFVTANFPAATAHQATFRLDACSTLATLASLRGYHYADFEHRGEWPQVVDRLADKWPSWP
ncbi:MAG: hypothetical protein H0V06_02235 [Gemmatimonadetes bacterium]|nr:hypothetical protein [Gemmatimonadota bacterium]